VINIKPYDVAIVGGGPAGMTAAVQAYRSDMSVVLFEKKELGGLLHNANLVENFPAERTPLSGPELVKVFESHLKKFDIEVRMEEVQVIGRTNEGLFKLESSINIYFSRVVILAAGTVPKEIKLEGMENISKGRVFFEIKDLYPLPENKEFVLIGGGDAVFDYSLQLQRFNNKVTILVRSEKPKCLSLLKRRVEQKEKEIRVFYGTDIGYIDEDKNSSKLKVNFRTDGKENELSFDFLICAVGRKANDILLKTPGLGFDFELLNPVNGKTNIPGLYLAGDIKSGLYRQVGIAVGSGLMAAMMAARYIAGADIR